jgi:hypothetical protein
MEYMKITQPESELLGLLKMKTIQEQYVYLNTNHLISTKTSICNHCMGITSHDESFADLTERLWGPAKRGEITEAMCVVADFVVERELDADEVILFFAYDATPIHRIVASLIALRRVGVEL